MKSLFDLLLLCEPSNILWIAGRGNAIKAESLSKVLGGADTSHWQGKRIAIGKLSTLEFISSLVFLDGIAEKVILLPEEDDQLQSGSRRYVNEIDLIIEGEGLGFSKLLLEQNRGALSECYLTGACRPTSIQTTWLLPTSGTTGVPKLIPHTLASLTRAMSMRIIGDKYIWGSLYSLRRFAGLQVFLQSWVSQTPIILSEEDEGLQEKLNTFISLGCNALSATPSMWRKLAMHNLIERLTLKQITLGGEIVDQAILDLLARLFPDARITHIYASTEAGVGFAVRDLIAGFPLGFLKHPPSGLQVSINEDSHLCFRGATNQSNEVKPYGDSWVDTGDVVEVRGDRVIFLGRANGSINVGGNKVMPEEIESVIMELPDIAFVQVYPRKSAILGNLIEAAITPRSAAVLDNAFKKKVIDHCRKKLDAFKVPAFIVEADKIELTRSGKLLRNGAL